jgi:hypothetical protein
VRHLDDVEAELVAEVRGLVVKVGDAAAKAAAQVRVLLAGDDVDGDMADAVAVVVDQGSERKGVLVGRGGIAQQRIDEVTGADVVHQVGELVRAEGIVAHVLDDGTAIGIGVALGELVGGEAGIALLEQRKDVLRPCHVDDLLVREQRVGTGGDECREQKDGGQKDADCGTKLGH